MNEKRTNKDNDVHTDPPADDESAVSQASSDEPHRWEVLEQFLESVPIQPSDFRNFARFAPLVSAILAPLSTLLDIPALTQHWFYINDFGVQDPPACVALSAVGLAFNVVGNILLVLRFSSPYRNSKAVSRSLYCWIAKTIIAIINIGYFGALGKKNPHFTFDEGYWAGVVSVITAGIISTCLLLHYVFAYQQDSADNVKIQLTGRKFMLSITGLFVLVAFQALAFSRLEGWKYFDGIYFSIQTTLTVGYGDLLPTTTWAKILVFPFAVFTIAQLANQVSIIISFIRDRASDRRSKWRKRYSIAMHRAALQVKPYGTLIDEICLIHQIELHQQSMLQFYDLIWSFTGLIIFYVVGAACFNAMEGWGYGNAVYAVVILSTSIGLGDYTPASPGGRVFWVIYALMCVPMITSFATNSVTGIKSGFRLARAEDPEAFAPHSHFILKNHEKWDGARTRYNSKLATRKNAVSQGVELSKRQEQLISQLLKDPTTHDVVVEALGGMDKASLERYRNSPDAVENNGEGTRVGDSPQPKRSSEDEDGSGDQAGNNSNTPNGPNGPNGPNASNGPNARNNPDAESNLNLKAIAHRDNKGHTVFDDLKIDRPEADIDFKISKALIDRVTHLESQSRQMLVDTMDESLARTVLLADRNLQVRDALNLSDFGIDLQGNYRAESQSAWKEAVARHGLGDASSGEQDDMLSRVRRYRDTFAEILVLSSTLLQLQGDDLKSFERWRAGDMHREAKVGKAVKGVANSRKKKFHRKKKRKQDRQPDAGQSASEAFFESEADIERDLCPPSDRDTSDPHADPHTQPSTSDPHAQPDTSVTVHPPPKKSIRRLKSEKKFIQVMARSVIKSADRDANEAREGWMDWLADKAYDIVSDAGHRVHIRHHRSPSGRMGWILRDHEAGDSGSETEGSQQIRRRLSRRLRRVSRGSRASSIPEGPETADDGEAGSPVGSREERGPGGGPSTAGGGKNGEEDARARAKENVKRRRAQEARRATHRQTAPQSATSASSSDESHRKDAGRQRMTLREHVHHVAQEAKERHAEHKARKSEDAERWDSVHVPDPKSVPLPQSTGIEPPSSAVHTASNK
ncbi:hypothetical protein CspHIS471_0511040 [Cutaneotrichosporon sp. HIS471]|nr:hypothetical protein CspHIS471_0511040 [Cutaneotrichosporon sp. HIS471]